MTRVRFARAGLRGARCDSAGAARAPRQSRRGRRLIALLVLAFAFERAVVLAHRYTHRLSQPESRCAVCLLGHVSADTPSVAPRIQPPAARVAAFVPAAPLLVARAEELRPPTRAPPLLRPPSALR